MRRLCFTERILQLKKHDYENKIQNSPLITERKDTQEKGMIW